VKSFSCGEAESIFRIYLGEETLGRHRDALLEFAERVERLPIAIVVGADLLRRELDPVPEAARGLRLKRLRNEVHDVAALLQRGIAARDERERRLLGAMEVCAPEGFWFPLTVEIAGLMEADGRVARNRLVDASLLRMLDRDRQRFQYTPCCGTSFETGRHLGNSRRLMRRPWRGCLPIGNGAGANAASACRR
jgi:hypothetical protein